LKFISTTIISLLFCSLAHTQPDQKPNDIALSKIIPSEKKIFYKLGDNNIPIKISQYGDVKNIICINVHDNEVASVQGARSILELKGGTLIKIENNHQRVIRFRLRGISYGFDPNRMFSRAGIRQTLLDNRRISNLAIEEIEKFAQRILLLIPDDISCIIALHNNTNAAFSITSYLAGHERQFDAKAVYADSLQDIDDIALTTDSTLYQKMADYRYNTIWQDNENAKKDGSLSVYCGEKNRRYINIETEHGKVQQYAEMFEKLLAILVIENQASPANLQARQ
jgi:hypothetical protein